MIVDPFLYALLALSVFVFALALRRLRRPGPVDLVIAALLVPTFFVFSLTFLAADYFTGRGVDASVIYHLEYGLGGAGFGEYRGLIAALVVAAVGLLAVTVLVVWRMAHRCDRAGPKLRRGPLLLLLAALAVNPLSYGLASYLGATLSAEPDAEAEAFREHYREPRWVPAGGARRNIVVIYAESLERSYFDEDVFPGLLPRLKAIEARSTSFLDIAQVHGTEWTIAGMVASQCGIPLVTPSGGNSMSGTDRFLPGVECLGEHLARAGYRVDYLSGTSLEFAGTGKFFETHGVTAITGPEQLEETSPEEGYRSGWGYLDDVVLEHARQSIAALAAGGEPYAYFISTMDTHHPGENVSRSCDGVVYGDGEDSMLNALACADRVISRFIEQLRASEFGDDVVIVLASDHLAMRNSVTSLLNRTERRNLLMINEPGGAPQRVAASGSMLDFTPTVAPFIGFRADMGLGRNLLEEPSLRDELPGFDQRLAAWNGVLGEFWQFPLVAARLDVEIDPELEELRVAGRSYAYPALLEIQESRETRVRFDSEEPGSRLVDYVEDLPLGTAFVWVQHCAKMGSLELAHWGYEICVMSGRAGTSTIRGDVVKAKSAISISDILQEGAPVLGVRSAADIERQASEADRFIAHAGGAVGGHTYTNSLDALDHNYERGFRLFELDIIETADGAFVAAHDWEHWSRITGYTGELPPSRETFLSHRIHGRFTPLDMAAINDWFERHGDATLVTDKVDRPVEFAARFTDRSRLMMELFSIEAVKAARDAGIRAVMTGDLLAVLGADKVKALEFLRVGDVALSRRVIGANVVLLDELREAGIRVYVFHVGHANRDERWVVCRDMDIVYGLYADNWSFESVPDCSALP